MRSILFLRTPSTRVTLACMTHETWHGKIGAWFNWKKILAKILTKVIFEQRCINYWFPDYYCNFLWGFPSGQESDGKWVVSHVPKSLTSFSLLTKSSLMRYLASTTERFTMSDNLLSSSCSAWVKNEGDSGLSIHTRTFIFHYRFCRNGCHAVNYVDEIQNQRDRVKRQGGVLPITL